MHGREYFLKQSPCNDVLHGDVSKELLSFGLKQIDGRGEMYPYLVVAITVFHNHPQIVMCTIKHSFVAHISAT